MKGTLIKTPQGWVVSYLSEYKQSHSSVNEWRYIPLHPDFIEMMDTCFTSKFTHEIEFEIVTEWENGEVGVNGLTYAKLITPNKLDLNKIESKIDEALANETPEKSLGWMWKDIEKEDSMNFICQDPDCPHCIEEINQMRDDDDDDLEDDVEKLELDYYKELEGRREVAKNFQGQVAGRHPDMFGRSEMHHMVRGYLEGYKKAKETLYTEEQVREAIDMATTSKHDYKLEFYSSDEIIQSLKQEIETYKGGANE